MTEVRSFSLLIHGEPEGKGRPKFVRKTGKAYTPKKTVLAEGEVVRKWEEAGSPRMPEDTALRLEVVLYVARPGTHFKADGSFTAAGLRQPRPYKAKPDCDNACKLIMDALNKKAYRDDVRIVEILVERHWADWSATKIKLMVV